MKHLLHAIRAVSCLVVACIALTSIASSAVFTAVASGNWSAGATWGGVAPNFNNTVDQIVIPAGINVTMDNNAVVNGPLASIQVTGGLISNAVTTLTINQGALKGAGALNIGTLVLNAAGVLAFTGTINAEYLNSTSAGLQAVAKFVVSKGLNLTGGVFTLASGATLSVATGSTITMSGGQIVLSGGTLTLTNQYNVQYLNVATTTGLELGGAGLRNVTIDIPAGAEISLGSNLTTAGVLTLTSGTLKLNGKDLTINGPLTAAAGTAISSTEASDISIKSATGTTGVLNFSGTDNGVKTLTINVGANNTASITGTVYVANTLQLTTGTLRINGANLTISGDVTGAGMFSGDATTNLTVNTSGGIFNLLRFAAGGQIVNNLTIDVGLLYSIRLGSNLTVAGTTYFASGSIGIADFKLTLNGAVTGAGSIAGNANAGLTINSPDGIVAPMSIAGGPIGTLTINTSADKTVTLASDLAVSQILNLQSGTLILNGNNLTVTGDVQSTVNGFIRSTSISNISLTSAAGTTGALNFSGSTNGVRNLIVNVGATKSAAISGSLNITNALDLASGTLRFTMGTLTLDGTLLGSGFLSSDATSNLVVNSAGGIVSGLKFAANGQTLNNITVNVPAGNVVKLASDLTIAGTATFASGSLDITGIKLTLGGALIGSNVQINSNGVSALIINTPGGLILPIAFTSGIVGDLTINVGATNTVALGSDVIVKKTLSLTAGTLVLNGNDLTLDGNVISSVSGVVRSTAASNISFTGSTNTTGFLALEPTGNVVGKLTVSKGVGNTARIAGAWDISSQVDLVSGILSFDNASVVVRGYISGAGMLSGNDASDLTITSLTGPASVIRFATAGQVLHDLTINVSTTNSVVLASDLVVKGITNLISGAFDISDVHLSLNGALEGGTQPGAGLRVNGNSALTINTIGGIAAPLPLIGTTIGSFNVNVGSGGSVSLGDDLVVAKKLDLESGSLVLSDNDLTIGGTIDATGTGMIASTNTSNLLFTSATSTTGTLLFDALQNRVNNLTVAAANSASMSVGTDIVVEGTLTLTSGRVNIGDNTLSIGTDGSIVGGTLTSFIETGGTGAVSMMLDAGAPAPSIFPVGSAVGGFFPASISLQSGSASGVVNVGSMAGVYAQGTTGALISESEPAVNNTWNITSDITSNLHMNLELTWRTASEVNGFNRTAAYISHYTNSAWDANAVASATLRADGMYSIQRTDIQSLSPFAIFDGTTSDVASEQELAFNVYPSPATDVIVIENLAGSNVQSTIDIIDVQGRIVANTVTTSDQRTRISLSALNCGVYYIKLQCGSTYVTKSFVKL
ncbi:MAG: T9SS type A sorting domain-containing protein [bacterium]|nr:T9SS type A sorting domain-containing protein [bacterium]